MKFEEESMIYSTFLTLEIRALFGKDNEILVYNLQIIVFVFSAHLAFYVFLNFIFFNQTTNLYWKSSVQNAVYKYLLNNVILNLSVSTISRSDFNISFYDVKHTSYTTFLGWNINEILLLEC